MLPIDEIRLLNRFVFVHGRIPFSFCACLHTVVVICSYILLLRICGHCSMS